MKVGTYNRVHNTAIDVIHLFESDTVTKFRVVTALWRHILLHNLDDVRTSSGSIQLKAKSIGAGVYEIYVEVK